jgi:L-ascorbate metabolism protein UlaG (beta-lactamase superfamily)
MIESPGGTRIITDPFNIDQPVWTDAVTVSHDHRDHDVTDNITGNFARIDTCGEFHVNGIAVRGFPGHHDRGDGRLSNIMYVFDIGDIRIAQFASQGEPPPTGQLNEIGKTDILIVQPGTGGVKMSYGEIRAIADRLGAKIVIPAHGIFSITALRTFADTLGGEYVQESGRVIRVSRASIDALEKRIVPVMSAYIPEDEGP